jgi:hypothetical protein
VKNRGWSHATSGVCQGSANHRLSVRRRVSRTPANDRTWMSGLDRSEAGAGASRAKAQKVFPAASMDGFTAALTMTLRGRP